MTPRPSARVYLFPAFDAPVVGVLRAGPTKCWHVLRWRTDTDEIEQGSRFWGTLYPERTDVSFDGRWMVYNAAGSRGGNYQAWGGVCELPWLKTVTHWDNPGNYGGGGFWRDRETLIADEWMGHETGIGAGTPMENHGLPFRILSESRREEIGWQRLRRDGWLPAPNEVYTWTRQPTRDHPTLILRGAGRPFRFDLFGRESLFDRTVTDATWDAKGDLLVARAGWIERYTLADLDRDVPTFRYDLNPLQPPPRSAPK